MRKLFSWKKAGPWLFLPLLGLALLGLWEGVRRPKLASEVPPQSRATMPQTMRAPAMEAEAMGMRGAGGMGEGAMGGAMPEEAGPLASPEATVQLAANLPSPTGAMAFARRKVIMTGELTLKVRNVEESGKRLAALANELGGFIAGSSLTRDAQGGLQAQITLRIPQQHFDRAIEQIEKLGTVENKNLQGQDVTAQFVDLQARMKSRKIHEERILAIMRNASKLDDLLRLEQELARIRTEIEQMEGQLRYLSDQVSLSTITVHLHGHTPIEVAPTPADNWSLLNVIHGAVRRFVVIGRGLITLIVWLVTLSPYWFFLPVLLGLLLRSQWRRWRRVKE